MVGDYLSPRRLPVDGAFADSMSPLSWKRRFPRKSNRGSLPAVKIAVIARQVGIDRKTVRKCIDRSNEVPTYYGSRQPRERLLDLRLEYLLTRFGGYPGLSA